MTLFVKSGEFEIKMRIPYFLLTLPLVSNKLTDIGINGQLLSRNLIKALKQSSHDYAGLEFVHVYSADGDEVIITL